MDDMERARLHLRAARKIYDEILLPALADQATVRKTPPDVYAATAKSVWRFMTEGAMKTFHQPSP